MAYIDYILILTPSWEARLVHLRRVLDALRRTGLTVNLKKSKLGQQMVQYSGFCIGHRKIGAVP